MSRRRGATLLETLVAVSLLGLLLIVLGWAYVMGTWTWRKADALVELSQSLQVAAAHLARDLEGSAYAGLSTQPAMLSCLVAPDERRQLTFNATGALEWQRFQVYYADLQRHLLLKASVAVPASSALRLTPGPLETLPPGRPPADYAVGGGVVARDLHGFGVSQQGRRVQVRLEAERPGPRRVPERVVQVLTVRVRN